MIRKRPLIAVLLAFVYPGLGHAYLRRWLRALLWFGLVVSAVVFIIPNEPFEAADSVLGGARAVAEQLSFGESLALASIVFFNMLDAYVLAAYVDRPTAAQREDGEAAASCPHCGKDLDEDLTFCHWCTTELDQLAETEASADAEPAGDADSVKNA
ncbi:zinc ribbon domain-containing protein [Natranaeroarchaeum sulfidigenes]|uniref:Membrane protein containing Zn-ribbon domain n=1 Tax=Natranaeroarchaeum sulfidigenes TaxID=2784880 RepID=A0A897MU47_9EURY|nr:zinc ribbon domain-containing protein [Natranaeroarchaeum sulfidigenes]QSG03821.1 Membrane protein containing Zn-ribbon domain [Natranaeroarchaeum sulfidigenes]